MDLRRTDETLRMPSKISQGLFLGPNDVDPLAIRYQNEIEPLTEK